MRRRPFVLAALGVAGGLGACATRPGVSAAGGPAAAAAAAPGPVITPAPALHLEGIPPLPQALADRIAAYTDFRGHAFADWHPRRRELLVTHRRAGQALVQLHRVPAPGAPAEPLTAENEPVRWGRWEPREGRYLVFTKSVGGSEADQIHRLDVDETGRPRGASVRLTNPDERHAPMDWLRGSGTTPSRLVFSSVPLDRTAAGGTRSAPATRISTVDPLDPASLRSVVELPGIGWFGGRVSPDGRRLALTRFVSNAESELWWLDLASGERQRLLPADGEPKRSHFVAGWTTGGGAGGTVWFSSDRANGDAGSDAAGGEFLALHALALDAAGRALGAPRAAGPRLSWDAGGADFLRAAAGPSAAGEPLPALGLVQVNIDGRDELRLFDPASGAERALPPGFAAQPAVVAGSLGGAAFRPGTREIALSYDAATGPGELFSVDADSGRFERWTRAEAAPGVDPSRFVPQRIVRFTSFDGRTISSLVQRPDARRFPGRRPVIVEVHGGPAAQAQVGFRGRQQFFVEELGCAVLEPNVRGSSGYGRSFLALDDGFKREDAVKDLGALLDWIATQPDLDASRVLVTGGSYGGYMSLAASVHFADRIAGAVCVVGISHFVTFLERTESYRRDLRRVEYGDERDPAMREFLNRISPLTNAGRIRKPLFVIHGKNDPRVPVGEAEQIVQRVRGNGVPVWYLRADNEGHGFARKENADFAFAARVAFAEKVLFGRG